MIRLKIENRVEKRIKTFKRGKIFFAQDLFDYGNAGTINKALYRLNEKGVLIRIAHGIYLYPKKDKILGIIHPSIEEVVNAVALRDRARIIPTGISALNRLGLSTQVPMNLVYLTDGIDRMIKIGGFKIKFKKSAPRNFAMIGEISGLVIQALKSIGKSNVTEEDLEKINDLLKLEKAENIKNDAKLAPVWIRNILLGKVFESNL